MRLKPRLRRESNVWMSRGERRFRHGGRRCARSMTSLTVVKRGRSRSSASPVGNSTAALSILG